MGSSRVKTSMVGNSSRWWSLPLGEGLEIRDPRCREIRDLALWRCGTLRNQKALKKRLRAAEAL